MNTIKKLALPLFVAGTIGMTLTPAQAEPTIIPYQIAQADLDRNPGMGDSDLNNNGKDDLNVGKSERPGDINHNGVADSKDNNGLNSIGDNTNDMADGDDSENSTFDATFWVLMALLAVGVVAMVVVATRRRGTVH